jgi:hypothetical protein
VLVALDGYDVHAGKQQFGDVVDVHLPPIGALSCQPAIDVKLILVVARDMDLSELRLLERKRFAEITFADGHFVFDERRRDPVGAYELEKRRLGFGVGLFNHLRLSVLDCNGLRCGFCAGTLLPCSIRPLSLAHR